VTVHVRTPALKFPGIYLGSMAGPWVDLSIRPKILYLGADWTISRLHWSDWGQRRAVGRGYQVGCAGAGGPCQKYWTVLTVTRVQLHHRERYFSLMKLIGGHPRVQWLVMDTTMGVWTQRGTQISG
jgi:hypothetical protein